MVFTSSTPIPTPEPFSRLWLFIPPLGVNIWALGVGIWRWRKLDRPLRILVAYLALCVITTVGLQVMIPRQGNNSVLVHLFAPLQLGAFAWMYAAWSPKVMGRTFLALAVAYGLACLVVLPQENLLGFQGLSFHIQTLLMLGGSLAVLCHLALKADRMVWERPGFWVASGAMADMAVSLVLYGNRDWLRANARPWLPWLALFRSGVVILSYACYGWAMTFAADAGPADPEELS